MTINILGTPYTVEICKPGQDPKLANCDGYTDWTTHKIVIIDPQTNVDSVADIEAYKRKVMRHEIVHAFFFESGLFESTNQSESGGAFDEQIVDWIAYQGEKIYKAWVEAGCNG